MVGDPFLPPRWRGPSMPYGFASGSHHPIVAVPLWMSELLAGGLIVGSLDRLSPGWGTVGTAIAIGLFLGSLVYHLVVGAAGFDAAADVVLLLLAIVVLVL